MPLLGKQCPGGLIFGLHKTLKANHNNIQETINRRKFYE